MAGPFHQGQSWHILIAAAVPVGLLSLLAADPLFCAAQTPDILEQSISGFTPSQKGNLSIRQIEKMLEQTIETKEFQETRPLKRVLESLCLKLTQNDQQRFMFSADHEAFKKEDPDAPDVLEAPVRLPPFPKRMAMRTVLRLAISKIPTGATLRFRRGLIEITTLEQACTYPILDQRVSGTYKDRPLAQVLAEFSDITGVSIVVDCRVQKQAEKRVSAKFVNEVSLRTALRLLTDMTDLRYVTLGNLIYVTSPANARVIEKEQADKKGNGGVESSQHDSVAAHSLVFNNRPLADVVAKLSECGGTNILLDARCSAKTKKKVTATLVNHVTLETALRILTDMTELSYVTVENVVYVTSPENARKIEKEEQKDRPASKQENIDADQKLAQIQKLLETQIETKDFQEERMFAKFLAHLETKLPKEAKLSLRIDDKAFGKELPRVAGAMVRLPPFPRKMALATALRLALSKVPAEIEIEYTIEPTGVIITSPKRSARWHDYQVADVVKEMPLLLPDVKKYFGDVYQNVRGQDGPELLVRLLMNEVELRPWESIQIRNGVRLSVFASFSRQQEIANRIDALRRLADVAVVINARLYEVDRAFFTKYVEPLFAKHKDSGERRTLAEVDRPLLKKILAHKHVAESDIKIRAGTEATLLSLHSVFPLAGGQVPGKEGRTMAGTGLTGVSFEVRPLVSPDRRHVRLQITQRVTELAGINKINPHVEAANLRTTSVTGTVDILDGVDILMPVHYRPPSKEGDNKVWLLVSQNCIWIEEEVKAIRAGGAEFPLKSSWQLDFREFEMPGQATPATPLPLTDDVKEILQAIVTDVLTNKELKSTREFYGSATNKTITLEDSEKLGWPKQFKPETHGYKLVQGPPDPFREDRVLGMYLSKFDLKQKTANEFDAPIVVVVYSVNGGVIGSCQVLYTPKRAGKRWTVELNGFIDP
jgi:hypothetical protein